jgi:DNA-binding HxlR family transcriptional regulator
MVLLDILGQRWTLRILWELREERCTFRELRTRCEDVSPTLLNKRLKTLRGLDLIDHDADGYGFTAFGAELGLQLEDLNRLAQRWAAARS